MKKNIYNLGLLLVMVSCNNSFNESEDILEIYSNGQAEVVVKYLTPDSTSFIHRCYYESGKLKSESKIIEGFFKGERIHYYENGNIQQIDSIKMDSCFHDNCCCDELSITRFDTAGQLIEYFQKSNGLMNGFGYRYHEGSRIEGLMKNGKKEGIWKTFDINKRLKWYRTYKGGILEGRSEEYPNDSITIIGYYTNDLENGDWVKVNSENDTIEISYYENGIEK